MLHAPLTVLIKLASFCTINEGTCAIVIEREFDETEKGWKNLTREARFEIRTTEMDFWEGGGYCLTG